MRRCFIDMSSARGTPFVFTTFSKALIWFSITMYFNNSPHVCRPSALELASYGFFGLVLRIIAYKVTRFLIQLIFIPTLLVHPELRVSSTNPLLPIPSTYTSGFWLSRMHSGNWLLGFRRRTTVDGELNFISSVSTLHGNITLLIRRIAAKDIEWVCKEVRQLSHVQLATQAECSLAPLHLAVALGLEDLAIELVAQGVTKHILSARKRKHIDFLRSDASERLRELLSGEAE